MKRLYVVFTEEEFKKIKKVKKERDKTWHDFILGFIEDTESGV